MNETELDAVLAAARQETEPLPSGLQARILADAATVQAELFDRSGGKGRGQDNQLSPLQQLAAALGGWPAMGGLATAGAAGLWVGLAPPAFVPDPVDMVLAQSEVEELYFGTELTGFLGEGS
ncbi:hypothetical protein [Primorskyibacter sp. S87]|uniref:hypothetical protein n=1 Tax=Primorskyibacter sp. S87 TaxID=3415126 RepID=UPI003C7B30E2